MTTSLMGGSGGDNSQNANVVLTMTGDQYQASAAQAKKDTDSLADSVDRLAGKLDGLAKRAGKKLQLFGTADVAGLGAMTASAAKFEKQMGTLQARFDGTKQSMGDLTKEIVGLTKQFPISSSAAIALTQQITQLGVQGTQSINKVSKSMIQLSAATGDNLSSLTTSMVQLGRQMNTSVDGLGKYANAVFQVSRTSGVSAQSVLSFAQAIAPIAQAAGIGETKLLGISAAFTKAGADGYAAATTFQQMLQEIMKDVTTGSPDLAKFSDLIGVTTQEFAKMDKAQAIAKIFDAINKSGPNAVKLLNQMGYDGIRASKSITAVAQQSGGLTKAINDAVKAYGGNDLSSASKKAFTGVSDQLTTIKNDFAEVGRAIGANFLGPLEFVLKPLAAIANLIATIAASPLGKVAAGIAAGTGALALGGGTMLRTLSLASKIGTAAYVGRSAPVGGMIGGFRAGRNPDDLASNTWADAYTGGALDKKPLTRGMFLLGQGAGRLFGRNGTAPGFNAGGILSSPLRAAAWAVRGQADFMREARQPGFEREGMGLEKSLGGFWQSARSAMMHPRAAVAGFRGGGEAGVEAEQALKEGAKGAREFASATVRAAVTSREYGTVQRQMAGAAGGLMKAFVRLTYETNKTALSTIAAGGRMVGGAAARGLGNLATSFFGSPLMMGIAGGTALYAGLKSDSAANAAAQTATPDMFTPINKYNEALGQSAVTLDSFTAAVNAATAALPHADTVQQGLDVNSSVSSYALTPGRKLTDDTFSKFKTNAQRRAYIAGMNITNGAQAQQVVADVITSAGVNNAKTVFKGLNVGQPDILDTVNATQASNRQSAFKTLFWHARQSDQTLPVVASTVGGIVSRAQDAQTKYNDAYGQKLAGRDITQLLTQTFAFGKGYKGLDTHAPIGLQSAGNQANLVTAQTVLKAIGDKFNVDLSKLDVRSIARGVNAKDTTSAQITRDVVSQLLKTDQGKKLFSQFGVSSTKDLGTLSDSSLAKLMTSAIPIEQQRAMATGKAGAAVYGTSAEAQSVSQAINQPANVNAQFQGRDALIAIMKKNTGDFASASSALEKFTDSIQNTTGPMYALATAAQAYLEQQRQVSLQYMNRNQQFGSNMGEARQLMSATGPDAEAKRKQGEQLASQTQGSAYQYLQGLVEAQKNYGIQMKRAEEDRTTQLFRIDRDYYIQMNQAAQDFHHSQMIAQRDYTKQMTRMAQDAADSMYNPYERVMNKITAGSGTLVQNLKDQTQQMVEQLANVSRLKKQGLSQTAIDTLDLTNSQNAQQVSRLVGDVQTDPNQIKQLNAAAAQRQAAGGALATTSMSKTFRRSQEDFKTSMADAQYNYDTMVSRAKDAHQRALGDMATDWKKQTQRALEDLARYGEQVSGTFADVFAQATSAVTKNMGQMGSTIQQQLTAMKSIFGDAFQAGNSAGTGNYSSAGVNPVLAPKTPYEPGGSTYNQQVPKFAGGGIIARVGEAGPESIIPLNAQGAAFMADTLALAMKRLNTSVMSPAYATHGGSNTTMVDNSMKILGPITVKATDPRQLQTQMEARAKLNRLKGAAA